MRHVNVGRYPIHLANGKTLAPGEEVGLSPPLDPHDQDHVDQGRLLAADRPTAKTRSRKTEDGGDQ